MNRHSNGYRNGGFIGVFAMLKSIFLLICVLLTTFFVVGYAAGWITIDRNDRNETATIEIDTGEVKSTANEALEEGRELLSEAGDKLRDLGESSESETSASESEARLRAEKEPATANPHSTGDSSPAVPR